MAKNEMSRHQVSQHYLSFKQVFIDWFGSWLCFSNSDYNVLRCRQEKDKHRGRAPERGGDVGELVSEMH
jgi:hypothetical protein